MSQKIKIKDLTPNIKGDYSLIFEIHKIVEKISNP